MKSGWKTTEFWLTIVSYIVSGLLMSGVISDGTIMYQALGIVASALTTAGYAVSRGLAKKAP